MSRFSFNDYNEDTYNTFEKRKRKQHDGYQKVDQKRQKRDNYSEQRKLKRGEYDND